MKTTKHLGVALSLILCLSSFSNFTHAQTASDQPSRLAVSFYSICCGIDQKAKEDLDKFIARYEKSKRKRLKKVETHWGREGEIDYCFKLKELSRRDQTRFISQVRTLLKSSKLVHINENATCQNAQQNPGGR
jgi:hypothetical protein